MMIARTSRSAIIAASSPARARSSAARYVGVGSGVGSPRSADLTSGPSRTENRSASRSSPRLSRSAGGRPAGAHTPMTSPSRSAAGITADGITAPSVHDRTVVVGLGQLDRPEPLLETIEVLLQRRDQPLGVARR